MKGILDGIRVVDWIQWIAGPECSAILGDLGADVIKVEYRGVGDQQRGNRNFCGSPTALPHGRHSLFENLNRNKRGIALDLKDPKGKEIMKQLVKNSDVFVTSFMADAVKDLGLEYEMLSKVNPKLIYATTTAWGEKGPDAELPGFDLAIVARSGLMIHVGEGPGKDPVSVLPATADMAGAYGLAFAVVAALLARERYGIGQRVESSNLGNMVKILSQVYSQYLLSGIEVPRAERLKPFFPTFNYFKCKDQKWLALALFREVDWVPFCMAVGLPVLAGPDYATLELRVRKSPEIVRLLDNTFITKNRSEWIERLSEKKLVHAAVNDVPEACADPQVIANEYVRTFDHPALGKIKLPGFPWVFPKTPAAQTLPAPEVGEHTEEILLDVCGYDWNDIARFKDEEII
ncbi:MAG: CoA transferase [Dehalococcoidia bacterium]|nr:CoA transferase [Dehalococcoidia bacterium]